MARTDWTKTYPGAVTTESSSSSVGKWLALAVLVAISVVLFFVARSLVGFREADGLRLEEWTEVVAPLDDGRCWWVGEGELQNTGEEELDLRLLFMKPGGTGLRVDLQEPLPAGDTHRIRLQRPMANCDQDVDEFKHGKLEVSYLAETTPTDRTRRFNVQG